MSSRLQGVAQPADVHVHRALLHEHVVTPHSVEQLAPVVDALGMGHEEMKEPELGRAEVDFLAVTGYAMRRRIEAQAGDFDRIEPLALELGRKGSIRGGTREHLKRIGSLLLMEHRMVGRAEIGDKPELLWEHPRLERLHALLEDEFEIRERLAALDRKLELAARTERTLVDLISTKHSLRVEWYIVALIVFEIVLTLYQLLR